MTAMPSFMCAILRPVVRLKRRLSPDKALQGFWGRHWWRRRCTADMGSAWPDSAEAKRSLSQNRAAGPEGRAVGNGG